MGYWICFATWLLSLDVSFLLCTSDLLYYFFLIFVFFFSLLFSFCFFQQFVQLLAASSWLTSSFVWPSTARAITSPERGAALTVSSRLFNRRARDFGFSVVLTLLRCWRWVGGRKKRLVILPSCFRSDRRCLAAVREFCADESDLRQSNCGSSVLPKAGMQPLPSCFNSVTNSPTAVRGVLDDVRRLFEVWGGWRGISRGPHNLRVIGRGAQVFSNTCSSTETGSCGRVTEKTCKFGSRDGIQKFGCSDQRDETFGYFTCLRPWGVARRREFRTGAIGEGRLPGELWCEISLQAVTRGASCRG